MTSAAHRARDSMVYDVEVLGVLVIFTDHVHRFNNDERHTPSPPLSLGAVAC
ncbi:MAG: hypothetical protein IPP19_16860 [Verrucomicrobia bacterium]|nr:hypothetical protein [Verrucomicrobiota bacterium]